MRRLFCLTAFFLVLWSGHSEANPCYTYEWYDPIGGGCYTEKAAADQAYAENLRLAQQEAERTRQLLEEKAAKKLNRQQDFLAVFGTAFFFFFPLILIRFHQMINKGCSRRSVGTIGGGLVLGLWWICGLSTFYVMLFAIVLWGQKQVMRILY